MPKELFAHVAKFERKLHGEIYTAETAPRFSGLAICNPRLLVFAHGFTRKDRRFFCIVGLWKKWLALLLTSVSPKNTSRAALLDSLAVITFPSHEQKFRKTVV
jgi:hypothetical protein